MSLDRDYLNNPDPPEEKNSKGRVATWEETSHYWRKKYKTLKPQYEESLCILKEIYEEFDPCVVKGKCDKNSLCIRCRIYKLIMNKQV